MDDHSRAGDIIVAVLVGAAIALMAVINCAPVTQHRKLVEQGAAQWVVDPDTGKTSLEFCDCFKD